MTINIMSHFPGGRILQPRQSVAVCPHPKTLRRPLASGAEALSVLDVHRGTRTRQSALALDKLNYLLERTGGNMQEVAALPDRRHQQRGSSI